MNYGMGGLISPHVDSTYWPNDNGLDSEDNRYGGVRFTTFMIYLSDVTSGGHTVFPQLGSTDVKKSFFRKSVTNYLIS
jgi:hypothetical protein